MRVGMSKMISPPLRSTIACNWLLPGFQNDFNIHFKIVLYIRVRKSIIFQQYAAAAL
jgi:hypothetical protein